MRLLAVLSPACACLVHSDAVERTCQGWPRLNPKTIALQAFHLKHLSVVAHVTHSLHLRKFGANPRIKNLKPNRGLKPKLGIVLVARTSMAGWGFNTKVKPCILDLSEATLPRAGVSKPAEEREREREREPWTHIPRPNSVWVLG